MHDENCKHGAYFWASPKLRVHDVGARGDYYFLGRDT